MTVLGWAVLQKGYEMKRLSGAGLQAGSELQAALGTGAGAGAVLKAEQSVAGFLQGSHLMTELVAGFWLVAPVSEVIIYSVFVHLNL
jgi:hypothetical protein